MTVDPADAFAGLDVVGAPRELVALGGTLDTATLVAAYRHGCFPWPATGPGSGALDRAASRLARRGLLPVLPGTSGLVPWCSPDPRAVLLPHRLHVPRSLRQRLRRSGWEVTLDLAFDAVLDGCADRAQTWITPGMRAAYSALHRAGRAHSVEVWAGDRLVGGLYGVLTGAVFSGESMFSRESDASKVALTDLCDRLVHGGAQVLDTQQASAHLAVLGQVLVSRREYVGVVLALRDRPVVLPGGRRAAAELAG